MILPFVRECLAQGRWVRALLAFQGSQGEPHNFTDSTVTAAALLAGGVFPHEWESALRLLAKCPPEYRVTATPYLMVPCLKSSAPTSLKVKMLSKGIRRAKKHTENDATVEGGGLAIDVVVEEASRRLDWQSALSVMAVAGIVSPAACSILFRRFPTHSLILRRSLMRQCNVAADVVNPLLLKYTPQWTDAISYYFRIRYETKENRLAALLRVAEHDASAAIETCRDSVEGAAVVRHVLLHSKGRSKPVVSDKSQLLGTSIESDALLRWVYISSRDHVDTLDIANSNNVVSFASESQDHLEAMLHASTSWRAAVALLKAVTIGERGASPRNVVTFPVRGMLALAYANSNELPHIVETCQGCAYSPNEVCRLLQAAKCNAFPWVVALRLALSDPVRLESPLCRKLVTEVVGLRCPHLWASALRCVGDEGLSRYDYDWLCSRHDWRSLAPDANDDRRVLPTTRQLLRTTAAPHRVVDALPLLAAPSKNPGSSVEAAAAYFAQGYEPQHVFLDELQRHSSNPVQFPICSPQQQRLAVQAAISKGGGWEAAFRLLTCNGRKTVDPLGGTLISTLNGMDRDQWEDAVRLVVAYPRSCTRHVALVVLRSFSTPSEILKLLAAVVPVDRAREVFSGGHASVTQRTEA